DVGEQRGERRRGPRPDKCRPEGDRDPTLGAAIDAYSNHAVTLPNRLAMRHQTRPSSNVSRTLNGNSVPPPRCWYTVPASHGKSAPPAAESPTRMPIGVATSGPGVRCGTAAIIVGKRGPRKKPSTNRPAEATIADGISHTRTPKTTMPTRHHAVSPATPIPARAANRLSVNRPTVRPSQ